MLSATPALADTPAGWPDSPDPSVLGYLLVLLVIPLAIALLLALLTFIPSMSRRGGGYEPGQSWRGENEWFGGPQKGVAATDDHRGVENEDSSGGTSVRW